VLRRTEFACITVNVTQLLSGIVDKHFVAGFVLQMYPHLARLAPALKVVTELGVPQAIGMLLFVLFPQMLQCHPYAFQFQKKIGEVLGQLSVLTAFFDLGWFNQPKQIAVGHLLDLLQPQPTGQESLPIPATGREIFNALAICRSLKVDLDFRWITSLIFSIPILRRALASPLKPVVQSEILPCFQRKLDKDGVWCSAIPENA